MIYRLNTDKETENFGRKLAETLTKRGIKRAYIAMKGEMGVGKTVFTRGFASHFGIMGVKSPTYTIVNEHRSGSTRIYHFDLYRIGDADDLESIGYHEYTATEIIADVLTQTGEGSLTYSLNQLNSGLVMSADTIQDAANTIQENISSLLVDLNKLLMEGGCVAL